jgi:hypothetical protein
MSSHPITFNPYAPPKSTVDTEPVRGNVLAFPRFSAWWVLLLGIITLGFYPLYWLYTRTKTANRLAPGSAVSPGLPQTVLTVTAVNIILALIAAGMPRDSAFHTFSTLVSIVTWVAQLIWIFQFRSTLIAIAGKPVGGVLTFFFSNLYFQYKINQFIDELPRESVELSGEAIDKAA